MKIRKGNFKAENDTARRLSRRCSHREKWGRYSVIVNRLSALYGVEGNSGDIFVPNFIVISVQGISAAPKSMPVQV